MGPITLLTILTGLFLSAILSDSNDDTAVEQDDVSDSAEDDTPNESSQDTVGADTVGTDQADEFTEHESPIVIDGTDGDDQMAAEATNLTLNGGLGDDTIESSFDYSYLNGDQGNDSILSTGAVAGNIVDGGEGNDTIRISLGIGIGGPGNDNLDGSGEGSTELLGQMGDDSILAAGLGSVGSGGAGDDYIEVEDQAVAYGDDGDDTLQLAGGTHGYGGNGNDVINVWNPFRDEEGPTTVTTGLGQDTIDVQIRDPYDGEADDIYLSVTDFDPAEDVLQVGVFQTTGVEVGDIEIVEAEDGNHTDVRVTYDSNVADQEGGIAVIRLEGTTGVNLEDVVILA